jgi:hypothetical protein
MQKAKSVKRWTKNKRNKSPRERECNISTSTTTNTKNINYHRTTEASRTYKQRNVALYNKSLSSASQDLNSNIRPKKSCGAMTYMTSGDWRDYPNSRCDAISGTTRSRSVPCVLKLVDVV